MTRSNLHTTNPTTSCPYMRDVMTAMVYRATLPRLDVVSARGREVAWVLVIPLQLLDLRIELLYIML